MNSKYTMDELKQRCFERVASVIKGMWEEKGSSDTRLFLPPLVPDEYVIVGQSIKGAGHKEHVVPRLVICDECHRMFADGRSVADVASLIRKYLKIVVITKEEQKLLDGAGHHDMKQKMPDEWTFASGDVYARLRKAGIEFSLSDAST